MPEGTHSILFDTLQHAVAFAKEHGGWIVQSESAVQWFDASRWQQTPIIEATSHLGNRTIGTWPMYEPYGMV